MVQLEQTVKGGKYPYSKWWIIIVHEKVSKGNTIETICRTSFVGNVLQAMVK